MAKVIPLTLAQWLLGKSPKKKPEPSHSPVNSTLSLTVSGTNSQSTGLSITAGTHEVAWEYAPTGDFQTMTIRTPKVPNLLYRITQHMILGVKYRQV